jgi:hypothetical protein
VSDDILAPIAEFLQHRFAVVGRPDAMQLYRWFEEQEERHRLALRDVESKAIDLWQRALEIRSRPFRAGESTYYSGPTETLDEKLGAVSAEFRMSQAILSVSTSKVAMDACLNGYYSQSLALIRGLFESWKRMAYARRSIADAYRWYPREWVPDELLDELGSRYAQSKPSKEWGDVFPENSPTGTINARDRTLLDWVNQHIDALNDHAHPTFLGYTQHLRESRRETSLHPTFDIGLASYTLQEGCVAEFCLIHELWELLVLDHRWQRDAQEWKEDFRIHFETSAEASTRF